MAAELSSFPAAYAELLGELKSTIRAAQVRAGVSVNRELVLLYWEIGRGILTRQTAEGWGAKVIDRLSSDLQKAFPHMKGFSARNLKYMRRLAEEWPDRTIVQEVLAQITWYHNLTLLEKVKVPDARLWYAKATIENGWSRSVLVAQIETRLIDRQGGAPSNFKQTLPAPESDLAQQTIKDPYNFDFLALGEVAHERGLEKALTDHLAEFLVELGSGFAYVGRQVHLDVGGDDFYLDLLFYHLKLHCYVVIELKMGEFRPEYVGKLNFYLSAADDLIRDPHIDKPTIGILLCKSKKNVVVEYALRNMGQPIGVSEVELASKLPEELQGQFPTIEQLESELGGDGDHHAPAAD